MFRLSLDLATKSLLPCKAVEDLDYQTRRFLARRLTWLFDNKKLPEALRELSSVVKDEGNTGAHDGTIDEAAAENLIDFTERLLTYLYTEPVKLRLAKERRAQRRRFPAAFQTRTSLHSIARVNRFAVLRFATAYGDTG